MAGLNILISGAGIAGPVVAHFLTQAGAHVTIVERASEPRTGGQNVDIRGHGLTILRRMGVEEAVREQTTKEAGLRFVDANDQSWADFPVDDGKGFTSDIEIMRGDLARTLYDATQNRVKYIFGDSIKSMQEDSSGADVELGSGRSIRADAVIAADGWSSNTRKLAFGQGISHDAVNDLGQWAAWMTIPHAPSDNQWARWYNAPGKRMILIRPDNGRNTRVSLWVMPKDRRLDELAKANVDEQKAYWTEMFQDAGWEADRVLKALPLADDFYMQKVAQVKLTSWSRGRVVVAGDAGYCPSPISGMGTTVAIVGSYILAGELAQRSDDVQLAFKAYEERMRKFVDVAQKLAPGAPSMANPQTALGIKVLYAFLGFVSWTGVLKYLGASFNPPASGMDLPDYDFGNSGKKDS
ncbi:hypothetical protein LTR62_000077 [Meristemomyces frigidus]|uniref:FAD-binding domain-containing protein n=1 Tax=Meristemomyces frigidus TaxID=1508187 RepID=A0AAN7TIJ3_9PEZI|nr:hypothetical protein LTR62_000077 [Meristemomyces frigidus]